MKVTFTLLFAVSLLSCTTSSISTQAIRQTAYPFQRILTLYVAQPLSVQHVDSTFYEKELNGRFNHLRSIRFRSQMEKTLKRNLATTFTQVTGSADAFPVNTSINYTDFTEKVRNLNAEAILLVNEDEWWLTHDFVYSKRGYVTGDNEQPNCAYHCYLIDAKTGDILWAGRCTVRGLFAGYENLNNVLARKVSRELKRKHYVL